MLFRSWYFKNYKDRPGERDRLVVNYTPLQSFAAGVVLQEKEETDSSEGVQKFLVFYFAPEEDIDTYMDEKMYSLQKVFQREILVDTACYVIGIEGRHEVWHTGVNGVCGIFTEYYREEDGEKVTDAGILLIAAPDSVTFEDIERTFGARVAALVEAETENKRHGVPASQTWDIRKKETIEHLKNRPLDVKAIVLADKTANLESNTREWRRRGDRVWEKFNQKDKHKQEWYFKSIRENLTEFNGTDVMKVFDEYIETLF